MVGAAGPASGQGDAQPEGRTSPPVATTQATADAQAALAAADTGLKFAANRGQWPDDVRFLARLGGADLWVTDDGMVYDFYAVEGDLPAATSVERAKPDEGEAAGTRHGQVVRMRFEGARTDRVTGHGLQPMYHNYLLGDDPAGWAAHVPLYDEVVLEGLYDGVDLRLYDDGGLPRYDLLLAAGADLDQVRVGFVGADAMSLTPEGAVRLDTALGPVEQRGLLAYQQGAGGAREEVPSAFRRNPDGTLGFTASADPTRALVVDPLLWSTFLGGGRYELADAVAISPNGTVTVAGYTEGLGFPKTPGAYDTEYNGGGDAFITGLSADGELRYSTFLGGSDSDYATDIALGPEGATTVTGGTYSTDFPVTAGAYDTSYNVSDAFIARLSSDGSTLGYATYLGGSTTEFSRSVDVGSDGSATVTGSTFSEDFPATPGAYDTTFNGGGTYGTDVFVTRLSPNGSTLRYSTYLGGVDDDEAYGVAVGPGGLATVVGYTLGNGFPTTPGAYDTSYNGGGQFGGGDALAVRLSANGRALRYSTFLGGGDYESATSIVLAPDGSAVVTGYTAALDFPTTPGAFDTTPGDFGSDAFVTRFAVDGGALLYSTFLGGSGYDDANAVALGPDGAVTVVGYTESLDFPTTPGADTTINLSGDAYAARLSPDGASLRYGTYVGGSSFETATAVAVADDGSATLAGSTYSADLRTTPGAADTTYNGSRDAFIARIGGGP
ncbi:MAG: hypothetical protein ACR2JK_02905 [Geodermatophilaceae bacterium]